LLSSRVTSAAATDNASDAAAAGGLVVVVVVVEANVTKRGERRLRRLRGAPVPRTGCADRQVHLFAE